jgi:hypothetical protein
MVLPVLYLGLMLMNLMKVDSEKGATWVFPAVFLALLVFSLFTALGLLRKKGWGMTMGYVLAICNLLVFPIGTAIGLFLLMGLVGATPLFEGSASERRSRARRKAEKKIQATAI